MGEHGALFGKGIEHRGFVLPAVHAQASARVVSRMMSTPLGPDSRVICVFNSPDFHKYGTPKSSMRPTWFGGSWGILPSPARRSNSSASSGLGCSAARIDREQGRTSVPRTPSHQHVLQVTIRVGLHPGFKTGDKNRLHMRASSWSRSSAACQSSGSSMTMRCFASPGSRTTRWATPPHPTSPQPDRLGREVRHSAHDRVSRSAAAYPIKSPASLRSKHSKAGRRNRKH